MPHVFGLFQQTAPGAARQGGIGIGLALVHGLTVAHGGFAKASSEGLNRGRVQRAAASATAMTSAATEREQIDCDVVIVGAGPAGLAVAIRMKQLDAGASIVVLEKGSEPGAHILSGAVMDPRALDELLPDWKERGAPLDQACTPGTACHDCGRGLEDPKGWSKRELGRPCVQDAGVGLDPQSVDKLFQAFYTTKSDGMGIGLSVSRSIIESHHGRIWAEPNDGPGATFSFSIPRDQKV